MNIFITVAIIIICLVGFYAFCIKTSVMQDDKTGRFYEYVKDGNNSTHAPCKNCGEDARLVYTTYGLKHYGTDCPYCKCLIWLDLWKKEDS